MREIEFRGKRLNVNKWVYGFFVQALDIENKPIQNIIIKNWSNVSHIDGRVVQETYQIELNTLGQYTGLKDKNGTRIFEGDIVKLSLSVEENCYVEFCDGRFVLQSADKEMLCGSAYLMGLSESLKSKLEVIGNIYDNPELIRGEDE